MIASITGKVQSKHTDSLILDIQGIGFDVTVTKSVLSEVEAGDIVFLHTYLVVREDMLALFGFRTVEEKQFFLLLLGAEGIGPRLAMAVLSTLSLDNIRTAVVSEQPEFFSRVPGIGKKTAQKIVIHLQGRISADAGFDMRKATSTAEDQVLEALVGLGYSIVEAQTAIQALPKDVPDTVEEKLRVALQYFNR
ncbi:MAG TPA: Holliday junction branch migration protein RuvA [Anaerolineaceae bacterium]|jgi:Holliday junction DNA helicase RuvA|nr:Holliday junction branch migration protein RuvA [Anaerolineaceae bacterium]NMD27558.1 Holliday junction branch migration protein RuvA [Chloroflexota bacterium]HOA21417.1 Holliday junction branch migration protein RuvA [Anaerolineaceae bacterium]